MQWAYTAIQKFAVSKSFLFLKEYFYKDNKDIYIPTKYFYFK